MRFAFETKDKTIEERERRLEAILESLCEGLCETDPDGVVTYMNPAALRMHGFSSLSEARMSLRDYPNIMEVSDMSGNRLPVGQWPSSRALRGERFSMVLLRVRRMDKGVEFVGSYDGTPVKDEGGRTISAIITIRQLKGKDAEAALSGGRIGMQMVLMSIVNSFPETIGAESSEITLYDDKSKTFSFAAATCERNEEFAGHKFKPGSDDDNKTFTQRVMESKNPLIIDDTVDFPMCEADRNMVDKRRNKSMAIFPMYAGSRFLGSISFDHVGHTHKFSKQDINSMHSLTDLATLMIDHAIKSSRDGTR